MMLKKYVNIRVKLSNATRLKNIKENHTYDEDLEVLLDYFDVTGIDPRSCKSHPIEETKKGFDRVIKILKSIEKLKLDVLLDNVRTVNSRLSNGRINPSFRDDEPVIGQDEVAQLVSMNESLSSEHKRMKGEISRLNKELSNEIMNRPEVEESGNKFRVIDEAVKKIESGMKKSMFSDSLQIDPLLFETHITSIKNMIRRT